MSQQRAISPRNLIAGCLSSTGEYLMDAFKEIPGRVEIRRSVRFRLDTIRQWVAAGCPN
jgi:hypothetical protein